MTAFRKFKCLAKFFTNLCNTPPTCLTLLNFSPLRRVHLLDVIWEGGRQLTKNSIRFPDPNRKNHCLAQTCDPKTKEVTWAAISPNKRTREGRETFGVHQNFTKLETRAYKTIKTQL